MREWKIRHEIQAARVVRDMGRLRLKDTSLRSELSVLPVSGEQTNHLQGQPNKKVEFYR